MKRLSLSAKPRTMLGEASVEPSFTQMTSKSLKVWAASDERHLSR